MFLIAVLVVEMKVTTAFTTKMPIPFKLIMEGKNISVEESHSVNIDLFFKDHISYFNPFHFIEDSKISVRANDELLVSEGSFHPIKKRRIFRLEAKSGGKEWEIICFKPIFL